MTSANFQETLVIHHLEEMWQDGYKMMGSTFWKEEFKVGKYLRENHERFSHVVLTNFELPSFYYIGGKGFKGKYDFYNLYPNIGSYITHYHEYGYGWEKELLEDGVYIEERYKNNEVDNKGKKLTHYFIPGGNHSEAILISDWMLELYNAHINNPKGLPKVKLCGAFLGECLEDMEIALKHLGFQVELIQELCL